MLEEVELEYKMADVVDFNYKGRGRAGIMWSIAWQPEALRVACGVIRKRASMQECGQIGSMAVFKGPCRRNVAQ